MATSVFLVGLEVELIGSHRLTSIMSILHVEHAAV